MESFLTDQVKSKLDFYKQLEDIVVPNLFNKNITYVMVLSKRISFMIDGIIESIDLGLKGPAFSTSDA